MQYTHWFPNVPIGERRTASLQSELPR
jgi:hypothetical protein